jgi:hypothetical protein
MNRLIPFISLMVLFSCKTPDEKAIDAVKTYVKQNLKDPESYQPGEFKLSPIVNIDNPAYKKATDSLSNLESQGKISIDVFISESKDLTEKYSNELNAGWHITHAYRAKNSFGALVPGEQTFFVDPNYNVSVE